MGKCVAADEANVLRIGINTGIKDRTKPTDKILVTISVLPIFDIVSSIKADLTRREQEIPHFYKWWDELRLTRRFLDFRILLYYNVFTNQSYLMERI